jgi:hypothetical protein
MVLQQAVIRAAEAAIANPIALEGSAIVSGRAAI